MTIWERKSLVETMLDGAIEWIYEHTDSDDEFVQVLEERLHMMPEEIAYRKQKGQLYVDAEI